MTCHTVAVCCRCYEILGSCLPGPVELPHEQRIYFYKRVKIDASMLVATDDGRCRVSQSQRRRLHWCGDLCFGQRVRCTSIDIQIRCIGVLRLVWRLRRYDCRALTCFFFFFLVTILCQPGIPVLVQGGEREEFMKSNGFDDMVTKGASPSCFDMLAELGKRRKRSLAKRKQARSSGKSEPEP